MVRAGTDDVFKKLESVVDNMKKDGLFYRKPKYKAAPVKIAAKKVIKKKPVVKKIQKKPARIKARKIKKIPAMPSVEKIVKLPFARLLKQHGKYKSRIKNSITSSEAKKIRNSKEFKQLGLKRIITEGKKVQEEPLEKIFTKKFVSMADNEKIAKAIELMLKNDVSGIAVMSGSELTGTVESEDIIEQVEKSTPQKSESLMSRPIREIIRPAEKIELKETFGAAIQKMDETNANRLFVTENEKPVGVISKSDVLNKVMPSGIRIETGIDKLLELIDTKGKVSTEEASKTLGVDVKLVEEWASILDDHNLIKMEYPIIGTIELIKK